MASLEKLLVISSEDKDNPTDSNSDFTVTLKESYYTQNVLRVLVKEITVPNVFPNIRGSDYGSSQNNVLVVSVALQPPITITIPEGQYLLGSVNPLLDFVTVLTNQINTAIAPATIAINYNELTNKLEFTMAGADMTIYGTNSIPPLTTAEAETLITDTIGLPPQGVLLLNGIPQSAPFQVDLSGYQNVYVHSKEVADTHGIDGDSGLIALVDPVSLSDAPFGAYAYKQENDDELASIVYEDVRNLSRLRIVLRDNLGNKLPIGNHTMNIVLKIYLASG
jgi:hypothetical protein